MLHGLCSRLRRLRLRFLLSLQLNLLLDGGGLLRSLRLLDALLMGGRLGARLR